MDTKVAKEIFKRVIFSKTTPYFARNQEPMSRLAGTADGTMPIVAGDDASVALVEGNGVSSSN